MGFPRVRVTIGQMMALTLVVALALAPIPFTLRMPTREYVVATGAYEIIFLPVLTSLVALAVMTPGRRRTAAIVALCLAPVILAVTLYVGLYAWAILVVARNPAVLIRAVLENPFVWVLVPTYGSFAILRIVRRRCPACGSRGLRPLLHSVPERKMWLPSGVLKCGRCGACSRFSGSGFWPRQVTDEPTGPPPEARPRDALAGVSRSCQTRPERGPCDAVPARFEGKWGLP